MAQAKAMPPVLVRSAPSTDGHGNCCENPSMIERGGSIVCRYCGMVHDVAIVPSQRVAFTSEEINKRWHDEIMPLIGVISSMSTAGLDKKLLSPERLDNLYRIIKINNTIGNGNRSLHSYYKILKKEVNAIKISRGTDFPSHVIQTAWNILSEVSRKKMGRGRTLPSLARASLYYACKIDEHAVFRHELYGDGGIKEFNSACHVINDIVVKKYRIKPIPFVHLIRRGSNLAGMPHEALVNASKLYSILPEATLKKLVGKSPLTVIASLFYIACNSSGIHIDGEWPTQSFLSERFHITEVSIRNRAKEIMQATGIDARDRASFKRAGRHSKFINKTKGSPCS